MNAWNMEYMKLTNHFELVLKKVMVQGSDTVQSKGSCSEKLFSSIQSPAIISTIHVLTISIKCLTHALWAQYTKMCELEREMLKETEVTASYNGSITVSVPDRFICIFHSIQTGGTCCIDYITGACNVT